MTLFRDSTISIIKKRAGARKLHFVTFGCKSRIAPQDYTLSKYRLAKQVENTNWFSTITCYDDKSPVLLRYRKSFHGRIAGYGWWKPAILLDIFTKTDPDDIVLYLDAGFNIYKEREKFFLDYLEHTINHNICLFASDPDNYSERLCTKRDLLIHMNMDSEPYYHRHAMSGAFFVTNNDFCKKFLQEFLSFYDNLHFVNNDPSKVPEHPEFYSHHHDQSVFSLLYKKYNISPLMNTSMSWLEKNGPNCAWTADRITDTCMEKLNWSNDIQTLEQIREKVYTKFVSYGAQPAVYDSYYAEYKKLYSKNPPKHLVEENAFLMSRKNK